jgi:hypothetical protein
MQDARGQRRAERVSSAATSYSDASCALAGSSGAMDTVCSTDCLRKLEGQASSSQ